MSPASARAELLGIFRAALDAVHGERAVERALRREDLATGPVLLLAAGKAACAMARGARRVLGERVAGGEITTREGHASEVPGLRVREAAHPVPDARGVAAARSALALAARAPADGTLLVLISGGASALWTAPAPPLTLADLREVTRALLRAGSAIGEINAVRKHLSQIKGGRLAAASRARDLLTLAISDVAGDAPDTIGSGPTAPDPTTYADAWAALEGIDVPDAVRAHLAAGRAGHVPETPTSEDPSFARARYRIVAGLDDALRAAEAEARARGLVVRRLGFALAGEARGHGAELAERVRAVLRDAAPDRPELWICGGEPVVRVRGEGRGGRAQELGLAFALGIADLPGVYGLFAGTDGNDGPTEAAGALVDGGTVARARAHGLDPSEHLERNDSHPLLDASGDLVVTGPTHTNVTDLALIRVGPPSDPERGDPKRERMG